MSGPTAQYVERRALCESDDVNFTGTYGNKTVAYQCDRTAAQLIPFSRADIRHIVASPAWVRYGPVRNPQLIHNLGPTYLRSFHSRGDCVGKAKRSAGKRLNSSLEGKGSNTVIRC